MHDYKSNIQRLFQTFSRVLSPRTLFIWATAMPVSQLVRGGVILEEIRFLSGVLRYDVLLANDLSARVAADHGFDVLDLHHSMRRHIRWRLPDGIHWNELAHRRISAIVLHHVCVAWNVIMPPRISRLFPSASPAAASSKLSYTGYAYVISSDSEGDASAAQSPKSSTHEERSVSASPASESSDFVVSTASVIVYCFCN